jgi:Holliday junction DNA helicase RuvA
MIASITGKLIQKAPTEIIVDCNGVGYLLNVSINTSNQIGDVDSTVNLLVHLIHREDTMQLFGFETKEEKEMFLLLISISGIGPKSAISILSSISAPDLIYAIKVENKSLLKKLPSIGAKTSERIIIELKDKVSKLKTDSTSVVLNSETDSEDAISAIVALGYNRIVAEKSVKKALENLKESNNNKPTTEEIIRTAFKFTLS